MVDPCWARVQGPLAPYADGFRSELAGWGYTPLTAAGHVRLIAHLSRWMTAQGLVVGDLTPPVVADYFGQRRAGGYVNAVTPRALHPLMEYLHSVGAVPVWIPQPVTATDRLLDRFAGYLVRERGLLSSTVGLNLRLVRPFLAAVSGPGGELELAHLTAGQVAGFVVTQARTQPRSVKRMVTALRSLLGFLHVEGVTATGLGSAIPMVAAPPPRRLPDGPNREQVAAMVAGCDQETSTGRRDAVILMLLWRLGLRAGEVAALGMGDIDWRRGLVTVRGKGNRHDVLPLPADLGAAIVAYLQRDRPSTATGRTVFVRAQAPHRALTSLGVTTAVAAAGQRAGLGPVRAHRLRHAAATAMLAHGGSLTEIGQVLRHRRPATTAGYAKVDTRALAPLARPWPGESV